MNRRSRGWDIAILTFKEEETNAVLAAFGASKTTPAEVADLSVVTARVAGRSIAIVRALHQGNAEAQEMSERIAESLNPKWILAVGIAGGRPDRDFCLGDIVVSSAVLDFSVEERRPDGTSRAVREVELHRKAKRAAQQMAQYLRASELSFNLPTRPNIQLRFAPGSDTSWKKRIRAAISSAQERAASPETNQPSVRSGVIGSSDNLVKDPSILAELVKLHRDLEAVDMESAGVMRVASRRHIPALAVRSISDLPGLIRSADWTNYACMAAAQCALAVVKSKALPTPRPFRFLAWIVPAALLGILLLRGGYAHWVSSEQTESESASRPSSTPKEPIATRSKRSDSVLRLFDRASRIDHTSADICPIDVGLTGFSAVALVRTHVGDASAVRGMFGLGWRSPFENQVAESSSTLGHIDVLDEAGHIDRYAAAPEVTAGLAPSLRDILGMPVSQFWTLPLEERHKIASQISTFLPYGSPQSEGGRLWVGPDGIRVSRESATGQIVAQFKPGGLLAHIKVRGIEVIPSFSTDGVLRSVSSGDKSVRINYDPSGRIADAICSDGSAFQYKFNPKEPRLETVSRPGLSNDYWRYEYDTRGRLKRILNQRNEQTIVEYDEKLRRKSIETPYFKTSWNFIRTDTIQVEVEAHGRIKRLQYSLPEGGEDDLAVLLEDENISWRMQLTECGCHAEREILPNGTMVRYNYDDRGNLVSVKTPREERSFKYNDLGQIVAVSVASTSATRAGWFTYRANGSLDTLTDSTGWTIRSDPARPGFLWGSNTSGCLEIPILCQPARDASGVLPRLPCNAMPPGERCSLEATASTAALLRDPRQEWVTDPLLALLVTGQPPNDLFPARAED